MFGIDYRTLLSIEHWTYGYGWAERFETPIHTPKPGSRTFSYILPYLFFVHSCIQSMVLPFRTYRFVVFVCALFGKFLFFFLILIFLSHILFCSCHFNVYYLLRFLHRFWIAFFPYSCLFFYSMPFVLFSLFFFRFYVSHSCNSFGSKLYHRHRHTISIVTTSFRIGCIFWSGLFVFSVATSFEMC